MKVCIIGSGPSGRAVAAGLATRGNAVVMLERGRAWAEPGIDRIVSIGDPIGDPWDVRRFGRGGAGAIWSGISPRLTPLDMSNRGWVPHSGWPLAYDELVPYYVRAEAFLGIRRQDGDGTSVEAAGLEIEAVPVSPRRFGSRSIGLVEEAFVSHLETDSQGTRVTDAVTVRADGSVFKVGADVFVVAAGGIETPSLLLRSGLGGPLVGRFFSDHLYVCVPFAARNASVPPDLVAAPAAEHVPTLTFSDVLRGAEHLPGAAGILRQGRFDPVTPSLSAWKRLRRYQVMGDPPPRPLATTVRSALEAPRRAAARWRSRAKTEYHFRVGLEAFPDPESRVTLDDEVDRRGVPISRVDLRIGQETERALGAFVARAGELVTAWGGRMQAPDPDWRRAAWAGAHHMGATRMGSDPAGGVVDADARVHGVDNVFVAGTSLFPTYGWANPTLTAVALAVRLADHLESRAR